MRSNPLLKVVFASVLLAAGSIDVLTQFAATRIDNTMSNGGSLPNQLPPGDLDPTFGLGGKITDASIYGAYDVAIQPDGRIVAVGISLGGSKGTQIAVTRYNIDGSPDPMFGVNGKVLIDRYGVAMDVAIQPDGKIIVASRNNDGEVVGELIRLDPDGSLDTSFGVNGFVGGFLPSIAATLPGGKLLLAQGARLFRLDPDGSFDPSFSGCESGGPTSHYLYNRTESIIQPDGKILTAFTRPNLIVFPPTQSYFGVYRCNIDGSLDTGFGPGGVVTTPMSSGLYVAHSIAMQPDGKIVVSGQSPSWNLTLMRYHQNGSLDTEFGAGGIAITPTGVPSRDPPFDTVAVQSDGKIVASTTIRNGSGRDFALVRYNANGSLDTTFGGGDGITTVGFAQLQNNANGMAIDSEGRAVVVGESGSGFAMARFLLGPAAAAVSVSGRVTTPYGAGLRGATVSITGPLGFARTATTSTFGFYSFDDIPAGGAYTIAVTSRRYRFFARTLTISDDLTDINFVGQD